MSQSESETDGEAKLPPGVGPHEGRELELMLAGTKPMAMFSEIIPEEEFRPHVESGRFVKVELWIQIGLKHCQAIPCVYYAPPEEIHRIARMVTLHREVWAGLRIMHEDYDWEVGRLLGYTDWEIEQWLAWWKLQNADRMDEIERLRAEWRARREEEARAANPIYSPE